MSRWLLNERGVSQTFSDNIATLESRLSTCQKQKEEVDAISDDLATEVNSLEIRLNSALVFVNYIAKRYEEGWNDPITERFYNEARELLGGAVERQSPK